MHAYTGIYGRDRAPSTRPKDLVDILLIASSEEIAADRLRDALQQTFTSRGRQALPTSLPQAPASWAPPYRRLAAEVGVSPELDQAVAQAKALLDPILGGAAGRHWDPGAWEWRRR